MRKHITPIAIIIVALCLVFTLCACNPNSGIYTKLNDMLKDEYVSTNLTITTTGNDMTLKSTFVFLYKDDGSTVVNYSIQEAAQFDLNGDIPDSPIITRRGSIKITDEQTIVLDGENINFDVAQLNPRNIVFYRNYFSNVKTTSTEFSAKVKDARTYLGNETTVTAMKVNVLFEQKINVMTFTYTDNGYDVEWNYVFSYKL